MERYKQADAELVSLLMKLQEKAAPIKLSIGYTDKNNICHVGIVIHEAAPVVVNELVKNGYCCDLMAKGMLVYKL